MIDKNQVDRIARLARLELSSAEKEVFPGQLSKILEYIDRLNTLDTKGAEPVGPGGTEGLEGLREDTVSDFTGIERLSEIAPDFRGGFYRVKKVIE